MSTTTIDVSGLPESVVKDIEKLVATLREEIQAPRSTTSIFDLFGRAPTLRSGAAIAAQVREERDAWGDR